jgi:hypothetical protein
MKTELSEDGYSGAIIKEIIYGPLRRPNYINYPIVINLFCINVLSLLCLKFG